MQFEGARLAGYQVELGPDGAGLAEALARPAQDARAGGDRDRPEATMAAIAATMAIEGEAGGRQEPPAR